MMEKTFYKLAPDISVIRLKADEVLLKSDTLALKLEGALVQLLIDKLFPLLDGKLPIETIQQQINLQEQELTPYLDQLVTMGVLKKRDTPAVTTSNFQHFLSNLHFPQIESERILSEVKIAIFGLEGEGVSLAKSLLSAGIKHLILCDPYPVEREQACLVSEYIGQEKRKRQEVLQQQLLDLFPESHITAPTQVLDKETIYQLVPQADFFVACFDKGFKSVHYWLNAACVAAKKPILFSAINSHISSVGPFVIPNETACYMCYTMRHLASVEDFEVAMAYEKHLNQQQQPMSQNRAFLPSAIQYNSSILSSEILRFLLSIGAPALASKVLEFNHLNLESRIHPLLQVPQCKVCQKKKDRKLLSVSELKQQSVWSADLEQYESVLLSPKTGIITKLELFHKDISEPMKPYIFKADITNNRFLGKEAASENMASGKGLTYVSAKISAMGEAVERYSGTCYHKNEITYSNYDEMTGVRLDPKRLVLFAPYQYPQIAFSPYDHSNRIGWATAYSLLQEAPIKVPAIAVFMNYDIQYPTEYICPITSNGLAAGKTLLDAILAAALEVIERDAFIIAWHAKWKGQRINPFSIPNEDIQQFLLTYKRRGVELSLFKLPTDSPCSIFLAIGIQKTGEGPYAVIGLGADFDPQKAAQSALLEVGQVRPALKKRIRQAETIQRMAMLLENPQQVENLEDHDLLFASPKIAPFLNFLLEAEIIDFNWKSTIYTSDEKINLLLGYAESIGSDLIYFNLTPTDMESLGLYTVRVIMPDLQPIHFGYHNIRLGGERLFHLGTRLGLQNQPLNSSNLDLFPHPLA
jgi:ribosomal protein S12 methylthiotransferase accessory factor